MRFTTREKITLILASVAGNALFVASMSAINIIRENRKGQQ